MSSYRGFKTPIIPSGLMTATDVIESQVFNVESLEGAAFQAIWSGDPTGSILILVSLDYVPNPSGGSPLNPGTWDNLGASVSNNPSGSSGHTYIPVYASCAAYIKLQYTNVSGSGSLSGTFLGKTRG